VTVTVLHIAGFVKLKFTMTWLTLMTDDSMTLQLLTDYYL